MRVMFFYDKSIGLTVHTYYIMTLIQYFAAI